MGIRFYCPNGHRLNVKTFLAGKRGICPHCEARFRIPHESQVPKGAPKIHPADDEALPRVAALPAPQSATAVALPDADADADAIDPGAEATIPISSTSGDPIAEAPDAVWYVRPPSGGQYGPASGEVMRRWIAEGRVSGNTLVWCDGWDDWQMARPLFATLVDEPQVAAPPPEELNIRVETDAPPRATQSTTLKKQRAKPVKRRSIAVVVSLVLLVVVLLMALALVLQGVP
jgi:hypothetical protein